MTATEISKFELYFSYVLDHYIIKYASISHVVMP